MVIHELNGHREGTWTVNGVNWLRDLYSFENYPFQAMSNKNDGACS